MIAILHAVCTEMMILYTVDIPFLHLLTYPRGAVAIHTVGDTSQRTQNAFHSSQRDAHSNQSVSQEKCMGVTALPRAHNN